MKRLLLFCLLAGLFAGCKKAGESRVEIYLLKSFTRSVDASAAPAITRISNPVLAATPLVADSDITGYSPVKATFYLKKNLAPALKDFGPDKAFAITINKQPVYVGAFRPAWLSSVVFGIATINPSLVTDKELIIDYIGLDNRQDLQDLDKRNDKQLLKALQKSGRLW